MITAALGAAALNQISQDNAARKNAKLQREFAQYGIRYRVADAKAAGIHPLAALGMSPVQASPVAVGADPGEPLMRASLKMADARMQHEVMASNKTQAETDLLKMEHAIKSIEYNDRLYDYNSKVNSTGKPLYVQYYDNIDAFPKVNGRPVIVYVLDEQAAEGMEGEMPKYMTILGNKKLFGDTIQELKKNIFSIK